MSDGANGGEQVFLVSIDPTSFERTVASPVDLTAHDDGPDDLDGVESARLYAVPEGTRNEETVERMLSGDLLVFYADGTYVGVGRVGTTFEADADWVAEVVDDDEASPHVVSVDDFAPLDIERAAVNRLFDYGPTYTPQGLMRVAPERVTANVPAIELAVKRFDERQT